MESTATGRLQTCLGSLWTLEQLEDREADAQRIRGHIWEQFKCSVPRPCPPIYSGWIRRYCEHFGKNFKLLPVHLRKMTRPPEGHWTPSVALTPAAASYAEDE